MKKSIFITGVLTVLLFAIWMYFRHTIWYNESLHPVERVAIFARDSAWYFLLLRASFVLTWLYAAFLLWTTGTSTVSWIASGVYALFLLVDNLLIRIHYASFLIENLAGELPSPTTFMYAFPEALFTLSFNVAIIMLFRKWTVKPSFL